MPEASANPTQDDKLAQKLMEELKAQGVDVEALKNGGSPAGGAPTAPVATSAHAEVTSAPSPKPETKVVAPASEKTVKPPEAKPVPIVTAEPDMTAPQSLNTPSLIGNESGPDLVSLAKSIDNTLRKKQSPDYWQVKISKKTLVIIGGVLVVGVAVLSWLLTK